MKLAVEEFLRFESSNQLGNRITTCATEIAGVPLAPRTQVTLGIGSANRDPEAFADPDRLDVSRQPNRHVAFGSASTSASAWAWLGSRAASPSVASSRAFRTTA